jgi:ankyrin repeat protein
MSIHLAARNSDLDMVRACLSNDPRAVDARDRHGWTPLHLVAAQGDSTRPEHAAVAELLLEAGADPNARDMVGQTPLHLIAMNGSAASLPVAQVLLKHGADVAARSDIGFDWSIYWQHGSEIRDLIRSHERR